MAQRVLVTGATGFVGRMLCEQLANAGFAVRAALRTDRELPASVPEKIVIGDIGAKTDWREALREVDVVVHAAARAHILGDDPANAKLYIESNAHGTQRLAEMAAQAGVRRLVFLSSVKVNGENSGTGSYGPADVPQPEDAYGHSKHIAEQALQAVAAQTALQTVCIRSPLVYGPQVRANFLRLMQWVDSGRPLPLAAVNNRRSLVSLWNLCGLLIHTIDHPAAAGRTWMVSDDRDLSTPELIKLIASAMNKPARLFSVPPTLLYGVAALVGKQNIVARLCNSLAVDVTATRRELGWVPPVTVEESIARTVRWYRSGQRNA